MWGRLRQGTVFFPFNYRTKTEISTGTFKSTEIKRKKKKRREEKEREGKRRREEEKGRGRVTGQCGNSAKCSTALCFAGHLDIQTLFKVTKELKKTRRN